jgi:hypothetical protein
MTRNRWLLILTGLTAGVLLSGRLVSLAQDGAAAVRKDAPDPAKRQAPAAGQRLPDLNSPDARATPDVAVREPGTAGSALQVALLRPYHFPFARPTPLFQVCAHLKQTLKAEVVLDLAALGRQDVDPDDPVQLELDGVRLKTGLKLLLDQVGLTFHVVAEDNLMIITDLEGADDPADRILSELKALHRDLHALQDDVDELREFVGDDRQGGRVRKPTIIEEMPDVEGEKPAAGPDKQANPRAKPGGVDSPPTGERPAPARVPLHGPRRRTMKRTSTVAPIGRA